MSFINKLKFDANGLIPCVVQDWKDGAVLMVAYMNREAVKKTLKTGKATFWSRSRKKFWVKGEQSGNIQNVKGMYFDCDGDCILLKVAQLGGAACHAGYRSCFYRNVSSGGRISVKGKRVFNPDKVYKTAKK
ncbi:MAG: phosphoribosyl-AMP cyclohydrolase [Elusimicrobiota bacterium]